jgi:(2Fe-2S) ferredoxin
VNEGVSSEIGARPSAGVAFHFALMSDDLRQGLKKAGISGATRHLFLCIGPDCCRSCEGEMTWQYMKKRLKEYQLDVMRTKAACFRICTGGPWLVIYPEGTWYGRVTPARFERILQEHVLGGHPIREWITARNDLGCGRSSPRE